MVHNIVGEINIQQFYREGQYHMVYRVKGALIEPHLKLETLAGFGPQWEADLRTIRGGDATLRIGTSFWNTECPSLDSRTFDLLVKSGEQGVPSEYDIFLTHKYNEPYGKVLDWKVGETQTPMFGESKILTLGEAVSDFLKIVYEMASMALKRKDRAA